MVKKIRQLKQAWIHQEFEEYCVSLANNSGMFNAKLVERGENQSFGNRVGYKSLVVLFLYKKEFLTLLE